MDKPLGGSADVNLAQLKELSALMDGELAAARVRDVCAQWKADSVARSAWHRFSLIGDVMRSQDLASTSAHDEDFLYKLRARMATEPVVISPGALTPDARSSVQIPERSSVQKPGRAWRGGAAIAAGFVVVIGAVVATKTPLSAQGDFAQLAAQTSVPVVALAVPASAVVAVRPLPQEVATESPTVVVTAGIELVSDGSVIRDPQLDHYLLAHKQFSGSSMLGAPSGFLRNAAVESAAR